MSQQAKTQTPFIKEVQNRGEEVLDSAREMMDEAKERATDLSQEALVQLRQVPKLIRKHPMESVLLGFGAGVLAAFLVRKSFK